MDQITQNKNNNKTPMKQYSFIELMNTSFFVEKRYKECVSKHLEDHSKCDETKRKFMQQREAYANCLTKNPGACDQLKQEYEKCI